METKNRSINLATLSFNLLNIIFEFLDQKEIYLCGAACKRLNSLSESEINRRKFNELLFVKCNTGEVFSLNLDSMQTVKHYDLSHKLFSYGSVYIPYNKSTFFYGGWTGVKYTGEAFLIDKNKNIIQLLAGPPVGRISLVYCKNYVYAIGGGHDSSMPVKYNLISNVWEEFSSLSTVNKLQTSCTLIKENILITGYYFTSVINYDINSDSFHSINNLVVNGSIYKNIFTVDGCVYIIEACGNIYASKKNDLSDWEVIGRNEMTNTNIFAHTIRYKGKAYFIKAVQQLVEFNLMDKSVQEIRDL